MASKAKSSAGWVRVIAWITILAALVAGLSGPASRFGVLDWMMALTILRYAALGAGAGAVLCLIGAIVARPGSGRAGFGLAVAGVVAGTAAFSVIMMMKQTFERVPPIHDISTDTANPPVFVAVLPLRADASNPPEYAGPEVAAQQQKAFPDIKTVELAVPAAEAFERARQAVGALGWRLVEADPAAGRIEATDTTLWFGFKDDVVVRVESTATGSAVDIRSKSRVGMSDLGANAARVRKLIDKLQA